MADSDRYCMPSGLPTQFVSGKQGFDALCRLLSIALTKQRQAIANSPAVRGFLRSNATKPLPRNARTAERLRHSLLSFYSDPTERRGVWRYYHGSDEADPKLPGAVPSFEYAALEAYENSLLTADLDSCDLGDTEAFFSGEPPYDDCWGPALAALPLLHRDFTDWHSLTPDRKEGVLAAGFAAATILDDTRILMWASERDPEVAGAYAFVAPSVAPDAWSEPEGPQAVPAHGDAAGTLRSNALRLSAAADELAEQTPTTETFDLIAGLARQIADLREPILSSLTRETVAVSLDDWAKRLREKSSSTPWLADHVEDLIEAWRAAYPPHSMIDLEELDSNLERAKLAFDESLATWEASVAGLENAKAARDSLESLIAAKDIASDADLELHESQSATYRQALQATGLAKKKVLEVTRPQQDASANASIPGATSDKTAPPPSRPPQTAALQDRADEVQPQAGPPQTRALPMPSSPPERTPENEPKDLDRAQDAPESGQLTELADPKQDAPSAMSEAEEEATTRARLVKAAVWDAIGQGRLGLAYHIANLGQATKAYAGSPTPDLLASVALGRAVRGPSDAVAHEFGERVGELLAGVGVGDTEDDTDALNLLVFCAAVRPALFASQHGAAIQLLSDLELSAGLTPVYRLAGELAKRAKDMQAVALDVPTLVALLNQGDWAERMARHAQEVRLWRSSANAVTIPFKPASAVWKQWLAADGILSELTALISTDNARHEARVRELTESLSTRRSVDGLLESTYRKVLGRRGNRIAGRALSQFERHLAEPLGLAQEWLQLINAKPGAGRYEEKVVDRLRQDMKRHLPAARDAIQRLRNDRSGTALVGTLSLADELAGSLAEIFLHDAPVDEEIAISPVRALSDDLLLVPRVIVDERGTIDEPIKPEDALSLLIDPDEHATTFVEAFGIRLAKDDLHGAGEICDRMADEDDPSEAGCRERLQVAIATSRRLSRGKLDDLNEKLEQAFIIGEISDDERADLTDAITGARRQLGVPDEVLQASRSVVAIEGAIAPRFAKGIGKIKAELDAHLPRNDVREQEAVERALAEEDLTILLEQRDCLASGQPLISPDAGQRSRFLDFVRVAEGIADTLDGEAEPSHDALVRAASGRRDILGVRFSSLSTAQAKRAAAFLETWYLMTRSDGVDPGLISKFFTDLGFTLTAEGLQVRPDNSLIMRAEPLRARELCPIHPFGSSADGRYEVVLNWPASARELIVQAIDASPNTRTFVLHFGKLTTADREWLRRWSIDHSVHFVIIDEALVLYLASLPGGTLRAMFDCTLPFTSAEPFFTAPGLVPPESFFGRESERRTILDPYGSCFVYGGRQLGKTALLRAAAAAFHKPERRQVAQYVDLKVHDIGTAARPDEIWRLLWSVFVRAGVIGDDQKTPRGHDKLVDAVSNAVTDWTRADDDSRILLLLDEADAFLAADLGNDFGVSAKLKGLMDETRRKFKVVLCGLHNVLRNTERANHPLAHLGEPVCIGPLLNNGDLEQARALIREPLAAVGYTFETANLLTQILVWTNYYPSLIQLYGEALLRYLRNASGRSLPYAISSADVQAVFARDQFRDYLRDRFSLTLQLDLRYEVIAYAMAADLLEGESDRFSRSLPSGRIFDLAKDAWPEGFDVSQKEFDTLLQEMCGLGVLRQRAGDREALSYVFRNPNVLLLLGDTENIWEVLYKERALPEVFEASTFHGHVGRNAQSPARAPLTYEQEGLLKRGGRVAVLCGTRAGNLSNIGAFMEQRMQDGRVRRLEPCVEDTKLRTELTSRRPSQETYNIFVVHDQDQWTMRWIERASSVLKDIRRGAVLRVSFVANPELLWQFVQELPDEYLGESNGLFDWVGIHPWSEAFLRRWCSDQNLHEATGKTRELFTITGGWPTLLERYAASEERTWRDKSRALAEYVDQNTADLLDSLGLGSPTARREVGVLRDYDVLTSRAVQEYAELVRDEAEEAIAPDILRRRLFWATQLGLVQDFDGEAMLNPLVSRILPDTTQ